MTYQIVLDSASDILVSELDNDLCQVKIAPLVIKIGQADFVDDENLDPKKLLEEMSLSKEKQTTSCPSPDTFINLFKEADYTFCITISQKLSGTYNAALLARDIVKNDGYNVEVFDSKAVAGVERLMALDILKYLKEGLSFADIVAKIKETKYELLFVLSSFDNLVKNGRMNKFTGIVASLFSIRPLFCACDGEITLVKKIRTITKALDSLVDEMPNLKATFSDIVITYCDNYDIANNLALKIKNKYKDVNVTLSPTRGLTTFYANKGGIIVSFR